MRQPPPDCIFADFSKVAKHDVSGRLASINVPVLLIRGAYDWITPRHMFIRTKKKIRNVTFEIRTGGHYPMIDATNEFFSAVKNFLSNKQI